MSIVKYVKSFSKGQITIPKEMREFFGIEHEFWLKLSIDHGKIIAEPVEKKNNKLERERYRKMLLTIKGDWFDENDYTSMRKEVDEHLKKNNL